MLRRPARETGPVSDEPHIDREVGIERLVLDAASWVDVGRGWIAGADEVFRHLRSTVAWQGSQLFRYDHYVEERRLAAMWQPGRPLPHPVLAEATRVLQHRYRVEFGGFTMMLYRDGNDGQAFHRDTEMRWLDDTVIALLTLGAERPWQLRPWSSKHTLAEGKGATHDLSPRSGDLLVMGGRAQADWQHSVPYLGQRSVGERISIQWRFARKVGRPYQGTSYRAPATYSRR
jgi:alkylated DNA repair dioxygenase AlkB